MILRRFISAFLFATFGRRRFTKWHLVGDSVGLQG
nr:MAG TPA: hypothetical protein [Bacteriophage sp.]